MLDDIALRNTGSSASSVASGGSWFEDFAHKFSKAMGQAGSAMDYQATPLTSYFEANTNGVGQIVDDGHGNVGHVPNGDISSLDQSGYDQAQWEFQKQLELLAEQRAFNSAEAQKNRDWQERMSNTAYQRAVEDLEAAGLNKWLAVTGGNGASASTPSGATASSSAGDASAPNPILYKELMKMISSMSSSAVKILGSLIAAAI